VVKHVIKDFEGAVVPMMKELENFFNKHVLTLIPMATAWALGDGIKLVKDLVALFIGEKEVQQIEGMILKVFKFMQKQDLAGKALAGWNVAVAQNRKDKAKAKALDQALTDEDRAKTVVLTIGKGVAGGFVNVLSELLQFVLDKGYDALMNVVGAAIIPVISGLLDWAIGAGSVITEWTSAMSTEVAQFAWSEAQGLGRKEIVNAIPHLLASVMNSIFQEIFSLADKFLSPGGFGYTISEVIKSFADKLLKPMLAMIPAETRLAIYENSEKAIKEVLKVIAPSIATNQHFFAGVCDLVGAEKFVKTGKGAKDSFDSFKFKCGKKSNRFDQTSAIPKRFLP